MNPARRKWVIASAVAVGAAAAGGGLALYRSAGDREARLLRQARFVDLQGKARTLGEWPGKHLLVNFWATWCAPCLEEIPMLGELRRDYLAKGVEVVGIAIDRAPKVREMAVKLSIEYPILLADADGLQLLRDLGNKSGGLPYTVLLDRELQPAARKLGALKRAEAEAMLAKGAAG